MIRQVTIGFASEGITDVRFLENIIQRTFEDIAFECSGQIEILPLQVLPKKRGSFVDVVKGYAADAEARGLMVLCVHTDSDSPTDENSFRNKINPAFQIVQNSTELECKNLVAIVPVQMTEAWMLADCELLKEEIGTDLQNHDLSLHRQPESYADPKQVIMDAITIARSDVTRRRRHELTISDLYLPMGQKMLLSRLDQLQSFRKFREAIRNSFRKLNYLT